MTYSHIESAKEQIQTLNNILRDNNVPFETRMQLATVYGSFKVIIETYEGLWRDRYGFIPDPETSRETEQHDPTLIQ